MLARVVHVCLMAGSVSASSLCAFLRPPPPPPFPLQAQLQSGEWRRARDEQMEKQRLFGSVDWRYACVRVWAWDAWLCEMEWACAHSVLYDA